MKKSTLLLVGVATLASVVGFTATTLRHVTAQDAVPSRKENSAWIP